MSLLCNEHRSLATMANKKENSISCHVYVFSKFNLLRYKAKSLEHPMAINLTLVIMTYKVTFFRTSLHGDTLYLRIRS